MLEPKPKEPGEGDGAKGTTEDAAKKFEKDQSGKTDEAKDEEK